MFFGLSIEHFFIKLSLKFEVFFEKNLYENLKIYSFALKAIFIQKLEHRRIGMFTNFLMYWYGCFMDKSSIKCIGGVLYGLSHPSNVDEFIYADTTTGTSTKYTKKILHGQVFFVAEALNPKFAEQLALQLLN